MKGRPWITVAALLSALVLLLSAAVGLSRPVPAAAAGPVAPGAGSGAGATAPGGSGGGGGGGGRIAVALVLDGVSLGTFTAVSDLSTAIAEETDTLWCWGQRCPTSRMTEALTLATSIINQRMTGDLAVGAHEAVHVIQEAVDLLEQELAANIHSRASHDIAKNAIGNIRARVRALHASFDSIDNAPEEKERGMQAATAIDSEAAFLEERLQFGAYWKQGNDKVVRKKPGRTTYANITLERVMGSDQTLSDWVKTVTEGGPFGKRGALILSGPDGREVARFHFEGAWPVRHTISFAGGQAIEKIEIAVEKVERA